jgi:3-phosphoglycerate kinase
MALDIGPKTIKMYKKEIRKARTIIWNGPMGVFEFANFSNGTAEIAQSVAKNKGLTIVGGGDSASAIKAYGLEKKIKHISTGGGASLELLGGGDLPGLDALTDVPDKNICNK